MISSDTLSCGSQTVRRRRADEYTDRQSDRQTDTVDSYFLGRMEVSMPEQSESESQATDELEHNSKHELDRKSHQVVLTIDAIGGIWSGHSETATGHMPSLKLQKESPYYFIEFIPNCCMFV